MGTKATQPTDFTPAPATGPFKVGVILAFAGLGVVLAILALFLIWSVFPRDVLVVNKLPVPVTKAENIIAGRVIVLTFDFCKKVNVDGWVETSLVGDTNVVTLPPYVDRLPGGCQKDLQAPIILPYIINPGQYHLHYKVSYKVNPIRTIVNEFDSAEFELLPQLPAGVAK